SQGTSEVQALLGGVFERCAGQPMDAARLDREEGVCRACGIEGDSAGFRRPKSLQVNSKYRGDAQAALGNEFQLLVRPRSFQQLGGEDCLTDNRHSAQCPGQLFDDDDRLYATRIQAAEAGGAQRGDTELDELAPVVRQCVATRNVARIRGRQILRQSGCGVLQQLLLVGEANVHRKRSVFVQLQCDLRTQSDRFA